MMMPLKTAFVVALLNPGLPVIAPMGDGRYLTIEEDGSTPNFNIGPDQFFVWAWCVTKVVGDYDCAELARAASKALVGHGVPNTLRQSLMEREP